MTEEGKRHRKEMLANESPEKREERLRKMRERTREYYKKNRWT